MAKITARDLEQLPEPKLTDREGRVVRGRRDPSKAVWTTPLGPVSLFFSYYGTTSYPPTGAAAFYEAGIHDPLEHPTLYVLAYTKEHDDGYAGLDLFAIRGGGFSISSGAFDGPVEGDDRPPQRRWSLEGEGAAAILRKAGIGSPISGSTDLRQVVALIANTKPWLEEGWPKPRRKAKKKAKKVSRKRKPGALRRAMRGT